MKNEKKGAASPGGEIQEGTRFARVASEIESRRRTRKRCALALGVAGALAALIAAMAKS